MSTSELKAAESLLLKWLRTDGKPLSVREALDKLATDQDSSEVSSLAIRGAFWQLVDEGYAELLSDMRIKLAPEGAAALAK